MKIGLIGIGYWGSNYVRILNELSMSLPYELDLYYCDINPDRFNIVKNINNKISNSKMYYSYKQMIENNDLDGVIVATPASTHFNIIEDIIKIKSNIYILCEKPLFNNLYHFQLINEISNEYNFNLNKNLMVGHTYIFNEAIQYIKKCINNNDLGNIYYIASQRTGKPPIREDANALYDLSYHDLYTILYVLSIENLNLKSDIGSLKYNGWAINSILNSFINHNIGLLSFVINNKIFININVNQIEQLKTRKLTIVGSKKMLVFDDQSVDEKIKIYNTTNLNSTLNINQSYKTTDYFDHIKYTSEGDIIIPNIKITEPLKNEILHFINCIKNTQKSCITIKESFNIMKILNLVQQ